MNEGNKYQNKLEVIAKELPEVCWPFIMETGTQMAASTRYSYATELRWFFMFLLETKPQFAETHKIKDLTEEQIKSITPRDISRYLSQDKDKGKSERTVARRRAAISSFFTFLVNNRIIEYDPSKSASNVKVHKKKDVIYIDIMDQKRLLNAVESGSTLTKREQIFHEKYQKRDIALISLLLDTGIRVSELYRMDIKDVDMKGCSAYILRKGGNKEDVFFSDEVRVLLEEYLEERHMNGLYQSDNDPLFVTLKGDRLSVRAIQMLVKKYAESSLPIIGKSITPHKLRSSFAMEYYDSTKDLLALQKKLGHSSVTTTNIYAKATKDKMEQTRNILGDKRAESGQIEEDGKPLFDAVKTLVEAGVITHEEAAVRLNMTERELVSILHSIP